MEGESESVIPLRAVAMQALTLASYRIVNKFYPAFLL